MPPDQLVLYEFLICILDPTSLAEASDLFERNPAVEPPERLLEGGIESRFASNVVKKEKFSDLLATGCGAAGPDPSKPRR